MAYQKPTKGAPRTATGLHRNAAFFSDLVDVVGHYKSGARPPGGGSVGLSQNPSLIQIRNDTGADLKLGEIVKLGDYLLDEENPYLSWFEGLAVDATFSRRYAITFQPIPDGDMGPAVISGMCPVRYTGTAPSQGDGMGPKPSQATAEKGFPSFITVHDVVDTTEKLVLGTLSPITTLLCKATAALSAGAVSSNFQIWSGTMASGSNAGFTTLPTIEIGVPIDSGLFFHASWTNNGWIGGPLQCNS